MNEIKVSIDGILEDKDLLEGVMYAIEKLTEKYQAERIGPRYVGGCDERFLGNLQNVKVIYSHEDDLDDIREEMEMLWGIYYLLEEETSLLHAIIYRILEVTRNTAGN